MTLDAGTCETVSGPHGEELLFHPPDVTLFHQVLGYLGSKPDPGKPPSGSMAGRVGVAAAALTLRWGSYLAVLLDRNKPIWSEVRSVNTSRISDGEMARINIEASAALADWIDIFRANPHGRQYEQLVSRAIVYLPMPRKTAKLIVTEFAAPSFPDARNDALHHVRRRTATAAMVRTDSSVWFGGGVASPAWSLTESSREVRLPV